MCFVRSLFLTIGVVLLFLLSSCYIGDSNMEIEISKPDESLINLASKTYNESQLLEIVKFTGSISELNSLYPIECLRKHNGIYRASYLGSESIAVLLFDDEGNRFLGNIYYPQLLRSSFDRVKKGQFLEDVQAIDPNGEYLFLDTGRNDIPKVSSHYTKDGYLITIEYDVSNTIVSINEELI